MTFSKKKKKGVKNPGVRDLAPPQGLSPGSFQTPLCDNPGGWGLYCRGAFLRRGGIKMSWTDTEEEYVTVPCSENFQYLSMMMAILTDYWIFSRI